MLMNIIYVNFYAYLECFFHDLMLLVPVQHLVMKHDEA